MKHITFIGASIGKGWDLANYSYRIGNDDYYFETRVVWEYDKSEVLEEVLYRPKRYFKLRKKYIKALLKPKQPRPNCIILKECSAYFPGDLFKYKQLMINWIEKIQSNLISLIIITVVPVSKERDKKANYQKMEQIINFNNWLRNITEVYGVELLDAEKLLSSSITNKYLRDNLSSGDGVHLNTSAYNILDKALLNILEKLNSSSKLYV